MGLFACKHCLHLQLYHTIACQQNANVFDRAMLPEYFLQLFVLRLNPTEKQAAALHGTMHCSIMS